MAQNSISGKITSFDNKEILPNVNVYISDLKRTAMSDSNGVYKLENLPQGNFLIEFRMIGYSIYFKNVDILNDIILNVELASKHKELNEVIVTGVSHATELRQSPIAISVISNEKLFQSSSTNIIDALTKQPGIAQLSTGGAISKPIIRGLGYNRVITLNNGIRQEGQQWGDEHGIEIDEYMIDKVEVIKGPGSLMYGSDGMAGVINFIAAKPVQKGKIMGEYIGNYQLNNNLIGSSFMNAGNIRDCYWLIRGSVKYAQAYQNKYDGKVFNSGFKESNANATVGVNKNWGTTNFTFSTFNQHIGMVEGERDSLGEFTHESNFNGTVVSQTVSNSDLNTYKLFVPQQQINHHKMASQSFISIGKSKLAMNFAFQQNNRKEFGEVLEPTKFGLYFLLSTYTYDLKYSLPAIKGVETTVGVSGMLQTSQNKGAEFLIPEYNSMDNGVFLFAKKSIKKLNVSAGVRFDQRNLTIHELWLNSNEEPSVSSDTSASIRFAALNRVFKNSVGSVGASYYILENPTANNLILKLNYSSGFRAPNVSELSTNGKHEGTLRYELGNANLKAENSNQLDFGINYSSQHITFELSAFNNQISNFIYTEKLIAKSGGDSIVDTSDPVATYKYVQGNALLNGAEMAIDIHPHPYDWIHFQNSFSFVNAINKNQKDSSKYLPFIPAPKFQSELTLSPKLKLKRLNDFFIKFDYVFVAAQNRVMLINNTESKSKAYSLVNISIGGDVLNNKKTSVCTLFLSVDNLFDVTYQNHLSRIRYASINPQTNRVGVFNMGRNLSVKLKIPLNFKKN